MNWMNNKWSSIRWLSNCIWTRFPEQQCTLLTPTSVYACCNIPPHSTAICRLFQISLFLCPRRAPETAPCNSFHHLHWLLRWMRMYFSRFSRDRSKELAVGSFLSSRSGSLSPPASLFWRFTRSFHLQSFLLERQGCRLELEPWILHWAKVRVSCWHIWWWGWYRCLRQYFFCWLFWKSSRSGWQFVLQWCSRHTSCLEICPRRWLILWLFCCEDLFLVPPSLRYYFPLI